MRVTQRLLVLEPRMRLAQCLDDACCGARLAHTSGLWWLAGSLQVAGW